MREVITGRSVLSMPNKVGGFRLRYGRGCNTGFASVGIHPVVAEILDHTITVGTQIKLDYPSKGATIAFVDSIETPTVLLKNGNVVKIIDTQHGIKIKNEIKKILHLGDILISFGDFLENNAQLVPTGYVEEIWLEELREKLSKYEPNNNENLFHNFLQKLQLLMKHYISLDFLIPLHPKFSIFLGSNFNRRIKRNFQPLEIGESSIIIQKTVKTILRKTWGSS